MAIRSSVGVEAVADSILKSLRPAGSALLIAHAELSELGEPHHWHPPLVTDDWWLDAIEVSGRSGVTGTLHGPIGGSRWSFPLPEAGAAPRVRGHRLARAAAQMTWQQADEEHPISQITQPEEVLDFIDSHPGLADACIENPAYLLNYAPQLALPGVAGWLQELIDETWQKARDRAEADEVDPDSPEGLVALMEDVGYLALRDVDIIRAEPPDAARTWVNGGFNKPLARAYEVIDYAGWLVSERSLWLESSIRVALLDGIARWGVWPEWNENIGHPETVTLLQRLDEPAQHLDEIQAVMRQRLSVTVRKLCLPETAETLVDSLLAAGFVDKYHSRVTNVTVPLIPKVSADLRLLQARTNLSTTDLMNRAISAYEFIDQQMETGRDVIIRDPSTKETQLVRFL